MCSVPDAPWIGMCKEDYNAGKVVCTCAGCNGDICDGEDYFLVAGEAYCDDCVSRRTAEYEGD